MCSVILLIEYVINRIMFTLLGSSPEAWIPEGKVTLTSLPVIRKDSSSPEGLVSHNNENENENRREHFTRQNAQDVCYIHALL